MYILILFIEFILSFRITNIRKSATFQISASTSTSTSFSLAGRLCSQVFRAAWNESSSSFTYNEFSRAIRKHSRWALCQAQWSDPSSVALSRSSRHEVGTHTSRMYDHTSLLSASFRSDVGLPFVRGRTSSTTAMRRSFPSWGWTSACTEVPWAPCPASCSILRSDLPSYSLHHYKSHL